MNCQFAVGSQRQMLKEMGSRKLMMILKKIMAVGNEVVKIDNEVDC
ncbi:hypothetical protein [Chryseobacterium sp. CBo1]|nr:hypothetical protein [Chryseobacterium sp. CBo1]